MRLNFFTKHGTISGLMMVVIALSSCGGSETDTVTTPDTEPAVQGEPIENSGGDTSGDALPDTANKEAVAKEALEAGAYCYRTEGKVLQATAEFLVEPDKTVMGILEATVTDDEQGYYTSYDQNFAGVLEGETLAAAITTNIEFDVQDSQEEWTLNANQLSDGASANLKRVSCEEIIALKASDKPGTEKPVPVPQQSASLPPATPASEPVAIAASPEPVRVQFEAGSTETTLKGNIGANQSQIFRVNAQEGQDMFLAIQNNRGKAVFDVEVDNGELIQDELPEYIDFTLPFSGDYIITVRAEDAGAIFDLTVRVQ